jgi:hypothetical protein
MKAQTRVNVELYSFFNLGARWGTVVNATPSTLYHPEKGAGTHCTGGLVGPKARLDGCEKSRPNQDFSVPFFHFIRTYLSWMSWLWLLSLLYNTRNTNIHVPGGIFLYSLVLCTSSVLVSLSWLSYILPFCLYLQNTILTSTPLVEFEPAIPASKRPQTLALDRSATGIGGIRSPDGPVRSESLSRPTTYAQIKKYY